VSDLANMLQAARVHREAGSWEQAFRLYATANELDSQMWDVKHNLALCCHALGSSDLAMRYTDEALAIKSDLWQSRLLQAKLHRSSGEIDKCERALRAVISQAPENAPALLDLADLEMNEFGDPLSAAERVYPLLSQKNFQGDAELTILMAKTYDRHETAEEFSDAVISFSARHMSLPNFRFDPQAVAAANKVRAHGKRVRIGLISPMFCISPVYFLTIGTLRRLRRDVDFIVFNRGKRVDAGTRAFKSISSTWRDVQHLQATSLANAIHAQAVDLLFDMGGWSDPIALKALSVKPAARQYKWVGGQSATTGLTSFDGFITDDEHSPDGSERLHSEPLIRMSSGYASYTPGLMPAPREKPERDSSKQMVGVIGNPAKISQSFIELMARRLKDGENLNLYFIDRRYRYDRTQKRVSDSFPFRSRERLIFIAPENRQLYLEAVQGLDKIIDTFPYSGGLTTLEAINLGVPIELTSRGKLFSCRHSRSHLRYRPSASSQNELILAKAFLRLASGPLSWR
jgi:protein O-GlcNAc transferase